MANITIVKLKVRRGSDAQRQEIVLDQGEVGYTLDSKRLFVGDGATYGGKVAGSVSVGPFATDASLGPAVSESPHLQIVDIGYANNKLYILSGASATGKAYTNALSGWAYIGTVPDGVFLEFDTNNKLTIGKNQLDAEYLSSEFFGDGYTGLLSAINGNVNVALNTDYLELSSAVDSAGGSIPPGRLTPKKGSITKREIAALYPSSSGLKGGNGEELSLSVNEQQFNFIEDNKLQLRSLGNLNIPISSWAGADDGALLGPGLTVDTATNRLETIIQNIDGTIFSNTDGTISLRGTTSAYNEMPYINVNKGLVTDVKSSVFDVITATGLSGSGAGDGVPIGSILPHAQAFTLPPAGYLLCNGHTLNASTRPEYRQLYDKIGTTYGGTNMTNFKVPNLIGGDVMLYGANGAITTGTQTLYLSATDSSVSGPGGSPGATLSASGVNFIIKYAEDPVLNIFNGAPNQVGNNFGGKYTQQICYGKDSGGNETTLSSAGFITMSLSGMVRNPGNTDNNTYDRFAIPVYSY